MPINVTQLALNLSPILQRIYLRRLEAAWGAAGQALAIDLAFDIENPFVQQVLGGIALLAKGIAETTRDEIQALVGRQAAEGWSIEELAQAILEKGAIASKERAELIAVTETARAYSLGSKAAYAASGMVAAMEWLTTADELTCDVCGPLNGTQAPLDGAFKGGITEPPAHPRCRCAITPVLRS